MKGDVKVIEYLNRALRHELTAVNQYWLHNRLLDDWGFSRLARKEREESIEEMQHADRLIERIIFLEGLPNLQTLDPLRIGQSLKEVVECDLAGEYAARALYREAREVCRDAADYVTQKLFEDLLADEEAHIDFLESQLELISRIGIEQYGLLQAEPADAAD
ncbi:bacterioferritin [Microvirga tunisiensis]|uniref:Bacterioferritin n=2 Tax=Pannonibacter tanglangensis TaxID=2750084 RepID=A0ABW9ZLC4_9HYPH|nr:MULTISPECIES: bacterioferritin [unclassified Pannonibacter]NBN64702.1 bacterioferritin [Pannonibacter sp. XCT-34]NBN79237.1 bacterioferritin [Pannonibacter sp. XCT-53]